jgi:hypothetical protein
MRTLLLVPALAVLLAVPRLAAADPETPITLTWVEGDYGGMTTIWSEDGKKAIGYIDYRQHREGDLLYIARAAYFADGSRDVDEAVVRVGKRLESVSGRSQIRDKRNKTIVDLRIDVAGKRLRGFYIEDGERTEVDEEADIGPQTYWGPLYMLVLKNFAASADGDTLVVQSVLATPKPRLIDMGFSRDGSASVRRTGGTIDAERYVLLPTVNFLIDPILQKLVPKTIFLMSPGKPPSLARFDGPRNYQGQMMRLE